MKNIKLKDYELNEISRINIVLGKNGCGKSTLLRVLDAQALEVDGKSFVGLKRYISPERGGKILYEANMETNINSSENWLSNDRRKNQVIEFRKQSAAIFRQLEVNILRQIERDRDKRSNHDFTFDTFVNDINKLLHNVEIKRSSTAFEVHSKSPAQKMDPAHLSSGESELISLAIECLAFESNCNGEEGLLILDEPDVHLHPDLQSKLMEFIYTIVERSKLYIVISTHSTPIIGALSDKKNVSVCFLANGQKQLRFSNISEVLKKSIPVFGAHPLTQVFNSNPILIVEGTDEERIWQQAVRSSNGRIKIYPVESGGKGELGKYEEEANKILNCVYDHAKGFSLRDGDGVPDEIEDHGAITRFRLKCYASENLLLADETLLSLGLEWEKLKEYISDWSSKNASHSRHSEIKKFIDSGFNRKDSNLKEIRNILLSLLPTNKPWEIIVGQSIAKLKAETETDYTKEGSLFNFLGEKICRSLLS